MRKLLLASVAASALLTGAAFATESTVTNVQVNALGDITAKTKVVKVGTNLLNVGTIAVGNALSVASDESVAVGNLQVNLAAPQMAKTTVSKADIDGAATISTTAVGNTAALTGSGAIDSLDSLQANVLSSTKAKTSLSKAHIDGAATIATTAVGNTTSVTGSGWPGARIGSINSLQVNALGKTKATTEIEKVKVGGDLTTTTVAVGNDLSLTGLDSLSGGSVIGQINYQSPVSASTEVEHARVGGSVDVTTQAVGNNAKVAANFDVALPLTGQANLRSGEFAKTSIEHVTDSGNVSASTLAVGNILSVTSNYGAVSDGGSLLSGQLNVRSDQTAITDVDHLSNAWSGSALTVATTAAGNAASFTAAGNASIGETGGFFNIGSGFFKQVNLGSDQFAGSFVDHVYGGNSASITTAALGNSLSVTGDDVHANVIQANIFGGQTAMTDIKNVSVSGALSVNTQAVGNVTSITVK